LKHKKKEKKTNRTNYYAKGKFTRNPIYCSIIRENFDEYFI